MNVCEPDPHQVYPLEVVVRMTGAAARKIHFYCRHGVIETVGGAEPGDWRFSEDAVRRLNRIEHLRRAHRMNWAAIRTIMGLMQEVEALRAELRFRR